MLDWIRRRFRDAAISTTEAVDAARDAVVAIWSTAQRIWKLIRAGWNHLGPALYWFADSVADLAGSLYRVTRGLVTSVIPAMISHAVTLLHRWTTERIHDLRDLARGLFRTLRNWAGQQIARLLTTLVNLRDYARHWLDFLRDRASRFWDRVADLVLHPEKLAAWLLPHLLGPLVRFLESRGAAIGRWLLERSVAAALRSAHLIESIIVRIL